MSNKTRLESDSMGTIEVPAEHYWGAQTQRSLDSFCNWRLPYAQGYLSCLWVYKKNLCNS